MDTDILLIFLGGKSGIALLNDHVLTISLVIYKVSFIENILNINKYLFLKDQSKIFF